MKNTLLTENVGADPTLSFALPQGKYSQQTIIWTLLGLFLAAFFASFDQNIVATALPRIIADLHGFDRYTWITTAYLFTTTVMIPIYGKLSDLCGRKVVLLSCLVLFLTGSILSGMAPSMTLLIGSRALQGLGAGGIMPLAMIILGDLFPPRQRAKWQGATSSLIALSSLLGPMMGGWITDHFSWRWVFYLNIPFIVLVFLILLVHMPALRKPQTRLHLDSLGAFLLLGGVGPLLLGLSWAGSSYPWDAWQVWGLIGGGILVMLLFFVNEARREKHKTEPIIEPSLFHNSVFSLSVAVLTLTFMGLSGSVTFLPLYLQAILQISATTSGLLLTPMFLAIMIGALLTGQLITRTGKYKGLALVGMGITIVGALLLLQLDLASPLLASMGAVGVMGLGVGINLALYGTIVQSAFPQRRLAQATATLDFFQELGGPVALAIMGSIQASIYLPAFHTALSPTLKRMVPAPILLSFDKPDILLNVRIQQAMRVRFATLGPQGQHLFEQIINAVKGGVMQSLHGVFLISLGILLIGLVAVVLLPEVELQSAQSEMKTENRTPVESLTTPHASNPLNRADG